MCFALMTGWFVLKIRSYPELLALLPSLLKKRKAVQAEREIGDAEIVALFVGDLRIGGLKNPLLDRGLSPLLRFYWKLVKKLI